MKFLSLSVSFLLASKASAAVIPLNDESSLISEVEVEKRDPVVAPRQAGEKAPLLRALKPVKSKYIVVYNDDASAEAKAEESEWISGVVLEVAKRDGTSDDHLKFFDVNTLNGYLGSFDEDTVDKIRDSGAVKYVEEDTYAVAEEITTQNNAVWGISRVSTRENTRSGKYIHDSQGGQGVTAYVVDTGIMTEDPEFEGRATLGVSVAQPDKKYDTNGHGTHVAGTIGSKTYGVAKKVDLVSVSVFGTNDRAAVSDLLIGFDYVIRDHKQKLASGKKGFKGSTLNMSIGGANSRAWTDGINALVTAGIHAVVAAGNEAIPACTFSPGLSNAITVGGSQSDDNKYSNSNYGDCVNILAPAVNIPSVGWKQTPEYKTGTSMASPHVAGVASYFLSLHPGAGSEFNTALLTPAELRKRLIDFGTKGAIRGFDSATPNVLVYNGATNPGKFWE